MNNIIRIIFELLLLPFIYVLVIVFLPLILIFGVLFNMKWETKLVERKKVEND